MSERRIRRVKRWRLAKPIRGTAERPRLVVSRGLRTIQGHFVNDEIGKVICGASTASKKLAIAGRGCEAAKSLGKELARVAREHGITRTVFDRNGYLYHGRVKALAEGAREGGLEF
ncbi:MAG TPA: 50S ribosomal protein L18 [Candidatus Latescibacteria bacterium]|jgi:large subunit ribosomal protein L18|nr:MAG: 50S ribosomal protein L18 [Candidatus Latescibacteria bacterium ADurb.Bin168]HNZ39255.1 50S ribosomal protein L18 [Candidatus Latescibacterota bacterium]HOF60906.1 50S ribosomal protein L18 [Candidatus Latescibacterota bacterium]HOM56573.1 50S ribosomal protein L18 [Candidatus Latescibacterota bacterium]HOS64704.1 50S ribosomal protein L18 [Candidatus Latescibacterota bacterium]